MWNTTLISIASTLLEDFTCDTFIPISSSGWHNAFYVGVSQFRQLFSKSSLLGGKKSRLSSKRSREMSFIRYKFNQQIAVFFIQKGKTALFYAIIDYSKCKDDVKDVLRYLVIEKGIDINSVDKVAFLRYFAFSYGKSIFRREGHPYWCHVKNALLSSSFSN